MRQNKVISTMKKERNDILKPYGKVFSKPQFRHFKNYMLALSVCEISSISRFSQLNKRSRSSMNRFLTESPWETHRVKSVYHSQLNEFIQRDSCLLIDDTISHRPYAKQVEKVNYHYDHTTGKDSLGYSLVTSAILSGDYVFPFSITCYYREEDCNHKEFMTKNEIAAEMIRSVKYNSKIRLVIFDTWYSNKIVIGACKAARKDYITQLKSNRNVTINNCRNAVRSFVKYIKKEEWELTIFKDSTFRYFSTSAFISKIGNVHLIYCQKYDTLNEKWGDTHFLISNLTNTNSVVILHAYLQRVGIESLHRDAKQNLGLEGYFLRNRRGIERYLFLVFIAYGLLMIKNLLENLNLTIGQLCEEQKFNIYLQTYDIVEENPHLKEHIFRRLAKARV